ncbi:hypothetical protein HanPSC8_Chr14g0619291 [Helianthus annuus]|nr:hypothetical protein HanPSC8_Chr14g0619291 [Helianthus annuus]
MGYGDVAACGWLLLFERFVDWLLLIYIYIYIYKTKKASPKKHPQPPVAFLGLPPLLTWQPRVARRPTLP